MATHVMRFVSPAAIARLDAMVALLTGTHMTQHEIAAAMNATLPQNKVYLRELRRTKRIYISQWKRQQVGKLERSVQFYTAGKGRDARKIKPLTELEIARRTRQRRAEDMHALDKWNAKRRAKWYADRNPLTPDWTAAWIPQRAA